MKNVTEVIKPLRAEKGYTVRELGELANVPYSQITAFEKGRKIPRLDTFQRLCEAMGIDLYGLIIKQ